MPLCRISENKTLHLEDNSIQVYSFMNTIQLPHPNNFLIVESLDYPNPYDFKMPHRHDYFEIILIKKTGGEQLIDFNKTALIAKSIYVVYPRQIHLLKRTRAEGLIIQFKKEVFDYMFPLQRYDLYFTVPDLSLGKEDFNHLYDLTQNILSLNKSQKLSPLSIHKSYSYLKILLISLVEFHQKKSRKAPDNLAARFLQLVSQHIREKRKVTDYAHMMNVSTDKLISSCKESLGTTPLKMIHEELLLEIKRLMVLDEMSLKEMAYELNFNNTSNFSSFVKAATRLSPSELQEKLKSKLS